MVVNARFLWETTTPTAEIWTDTTETPMAWVVKPSASEIWQQLN
jgi:hypothetical protein